IRNKNSSVDIKAVVHVEVITGIGFRKIFVGTTQVPLTASKTGIITRRGDTEHSSHGQDSCVDVLPIEVSPEADLLDLNFVGAKHLGRAAYGAVSGVVQVHDVVSIKTNFRSKEF